MLDIEKIKKLLDELLPLRGANVSIEQGPPWADMKDWIVADSQHGLRVVLRLVVAEDGAIRDVKEQVVLMVPLKAGDVSGERLDAYFRGWCSAVLEVLSKAPLSKLECLMPHDLIVPNVLALKKTKSAGDFRDALLAHSRLGRFIPA